MNDISLQPMTDELYHLYYKDFQNDISIYADESTFQPFRYDHDRVENYIKRQKEKKRLAFAIMQNDSPVGEILLKDIDEVKKACTLSIHLQNDTVKGKGIGTRAERLILDYAFKTLSMNTVYADCILKNTRSQHVLEKVGFKKIRTDEMFIYYRLDNEYIIKLAETNDELDGKGYVHYKAWHEAYSDLVDAGYLNTVTEEKCKQIAHTFKDNMLVAKIGDKVVGFACYGECRNDDPSDCGEVYAIYVLSEHYGNGIGFALMNEAVKRLSNYSKVAVWVLKGNERAIHFYERYGFAFDGAEKEIKLGTVNTELRMIYKK